jgi:hypothetical protein
MREEPLALSIEAFQWDDVNVAHLVDHDVTVRMVAQVRNNNPLFFRNVPARTASHIMIGVTDDGRHLRVSLIEVTPGLWRPITA